MPATMQAISQDRYGAFEDVLELRDVERPVPGHGQVLVRIRAASIHIGDVYGMQGVPYLFRPMYGLRRPKARIPGTDIAGTVEAVGPNVTRFKLGDPVFGWCSGAFAEYAAVPEASLATVPTDLSLEEASAIGVSAMTALQALRDHLGVRAGHRVLVTGASGGVGSYAVQIAKAFGAHVTGVCSTGNVELVRSLGADHVIDYTREDFTRGAARHDRILDNVGSHPMGATRKALVEDGLLLSNGAHVEGWLGGASDVAKATVVSILNRQQARPFLASLEAGDLAELRDMAEIGAIRPIVDRTYPLAKAAEALTHVAGRHARGTVVLTV